jgi:hypothetical protein
VGTVYSRLYRLLRAQVTVDYEFIAIAGVLVFLLVKALASTVFVYLDAGLLILTAVIIYTVRRLAALEQEELSLNGADHHLSFCPLE